MAERDSQEKSLFLAAIEIAAPGERAAFIDLHCGDNRELRAAVDALLAAHEKPQRLIDSPVPLPTMESPNVELPGTPIGPYKLLEQIGEGGFGVVYMAEQQHPVRRKVALKILKPGMDTRQVVARFEAERQALAIMDHPNIAKVHDGGATPSGRPYFVMELVKGVPITTYCDQHQLTPRQRLELFIPVCQAVQHAHQKGIIHRDLKPSNVLVTVHDTTPVPKVIDFGVAKALGQELTDKTLFTGFAQLIGTPLYMSPEQAGQSSLDIDTRSDIYGLGVLLYELLTGSTPFTRDRFHKAAYAEICRIIREEDPPKPSTRLCESKDSLPSISAQRQTEPAQLTKLVRGELDWIVMKALEKDRNRRYETANSFAIDIQRYLVDEPVSAGPPSTAYRFRKFVRRNRRSLATLALLGIMALTAVAAIAGTVGWAIRDQELRRARVDQQVATVLQEAEAAWRRGDLEEARAAIRRGDQLQANGSENADHQQRLNQWRADLDWLTRVEAIRLDGTSISKHGEFDWRGVDRAYQAAFADYQIDVATLAPEEASTRVRNSQIRDGLIVVLDRWAAVKPGINLINAQRQLAVARLADRDPWRCRVRDAVARVDVTELEQLSRSNDVLNQSPVSLELLADVLEQTDRLPLAIDLLKRAQHKYPSDLWINHNLGMKLRDAKKAPLAQAVSYLRVALARRPNSPGLRNNLAVLLEEVEMPVEAEAEFREAIRLKPDYAMARSNLSLMLLQRGELDEAEKECRLALRFDPNLAMALSNLCVILTEQGRPEEAETAGRDALRLGPDSPPFIVNLGRALQVLGKRNEAITWYRKAIQLDKDYAVAHTNLAGALWEQGKLDEAEAEALEATRLDPRLSHARVNLANVRLHRRQFPEAIAEYQLAIQLDPRNATAHYGLGSTYAQQGRFADAEKEFKATLQIRPNLAEAHDSLGAVLAERAAWTEAEAACRTALTLKPGYVKAHYNLGVIYSILNRLDEAEAEYRAAIGLDADHLTAHGNLANLLTKQNKHADAEKHFAEVVRLQPDLFEAHNGLGFTRMKQGKRAEAVSAYREAVRLKQDYAQPHQMLALLLTTGPENSDTSFALACALKAVELAPRDEISWRVLGRAQYRSGNWQECLKALNHALQVKSKPAGGDPGIWFFMAMAHRRIGEGDPARNWYTKAAEWMDENKSKNLEWLELRKEAANQLQIELPKPNPK